VDIKGGEVEMMVWMDWRIKNDFVKYERAARSDGYIWQARMQWCFAYLDTLQ